MRTTRVLRRTYEEMTASARAAAAEAVAQAKLPTRETYEKLSDEELQTLILTKDRQIADLRRIYENFHYEVDKRFRTMIYDYHDKALSLSKVHGDMQAQSVTINREALIRMRERDEARNRDRRMTQVICFFSTLLFWIWVRRHYVLAKEGEDPELSQPITGIGLRSENLFGMYSRNARSWDTPYEKELREERRRREADKSV